MAKKRKKFQTKISKWACDGGGSMWVAVTAHSLFTSKEFAKVCEAARREYYGLPQLPYRDRYGFPA